MDLKKNRIAWYQRPLVWGGVGVLLLVCALTGYILTSLSSWRGLATEADTAYTATKKQIIAAMTTENIPSKDRATALHKATTMGDISCEVPTIYAWQEKFIAHAKKQQAKCKSVAEHTIGLLEKANSVEKYLESEAKISSILQAVSVKDTLKENLWQKEYKNVETQSVRLEKLGVNEEAVMTHKEAKDRVAYLLEAWKSLVSADKDEDRDTFTKASDTLVHAYKGLTAISATAKQELMPLLEALNTELR
jgi:hypothetical protein